MILTMQRHEEPLSDGERLPLHPSLDKAVVDVLMRLDEASPLRDQLLVFKKDLGLRDRELVRLAGVSRATLSRWRKEGDAERPPPLDDLRVIAVLLIRTGALSPRSVAGWLRSRNFGLADERPLEVLAAGDFSRVLKAAEAACGARTPVMQPDQSSKASRSFAGATAAGDGSVDSAG